MKDKKIAILLAVLTGFLTWIYTFEEDKNKLWIALGITAVNVITVVPAMMFTFGLWIFPAMLISFGVWVWSLADVIMKDDKWYDKY